MIYQGTDTYGDKVTLDDLTLTVEDSLSECAARSELSRETARELGAALLRAAGGYAPLPNYSLDEAVEYIVHLPYGMGKFYTGGFEDATILRTLLHKGSNIGGLLVTDGTLPDEGDKWNLYSVPSSISQLSIIEDVRA